VGEFQQVRLDEEVRMGQEADAGRVWFVGREIIKEAQEMGEVAKRILFKGTC
jgi:hypothetical protein